MDSQLRRKVISWQVSTIKLDVLATMRPLQTLWSVLQSYQASQEAIAAALADPAAAKVAAAAGTKRLPGSKEPIDPDDWLPVSCGLHYLVIAILCHTAYEFSQISTLKWQPSSLPHLTL